MAAHGAAIYLAECDRAEIDHNTAVQGQNGLMVTRSSGLKIWNNTFQFLSGIGVGLYRTTDSTIMHNRIDWCVRGYSHGFYNRGQDSAGLLMYEQSSRNTVAYNSITHGGDGLFLWAGQSTMDTGQGGSNDNCFFGNDFSHAVTNGIEATFSRNAFIANRVEECWHGVWGGYSYDSMWASNRFARNTEGIAIEHGQDNRIEGNTFDGDETAIRLWQNATQDPELGISEAPRHAKPRLPDLRRTRSRATRRRSTFARPTGVDAALNTFDEVGLRLAGDADVALDVPPQALPVTMTTRAAAAASRRHRPDDQGRSPARPRAHHRRRVGPVRLEVAEALARRAIRRAAAAPARAWSGGRVEARAAFAARRYRRSAGRVPGEIVVTPASDVARSTSTVTLEYRGGEVVSPRGARTPAGKPYTLQLLALLRARSTGPSGSSSTATTPIP